MEVRVKKLVGTLQDQGLDAALVPSWDEFGNEVVEEGRNCLLSVSNFSGSNGLAIVSKDLNSGNCAFFTDGRYALQAKKEVYDYFELLNLSTDSVRDFLHENYKGKKIGFDPYIIRQTHYELFLKGAKEVKFVPVKSLMGTFKESAAKRCVEILPDEAGSLQFKLKKQKIFETLEDEVEHIVVTSVDTVSWLLNARVIDFISKEETLSLALNAYMLLNKEGKDFLYVLEQYENLADLTGLEVKNLFEFERDTKILNRNKVYISKDNPYVLTSLEGVSLQKFDIPAYQKCIKTKAECEHIISAHKADGKALTKLLSSLEDLCDQRPITEYELGNLLTSARKESEKFICNSFNPIVGSGSNGAIIHYRAKKGECKQINPKELLLIDSGGHYKWGTTDVTRTIRVSTQNIDKEDLQIKKEMELFTKVLQGLIDVFLYEFDYATGADIDKIARAPLREIGYNYPHSTGHGVGFAINVHEGPVRIAQNFHNDLLPGMIVSIEPGVYLEGEFGIRIENLAIVKLNQFGLKYFENITFVPIQENLVEMSLLSDTQKKWLIEYNKKCVS